MIDPRDAIKQNPITAEKPATDIQVKDDITDIAERIKYARLLMEMGTNGMYKTAKAYLKKTLEMPNVTAEQVENINELIKECSGFLGSDSTPTLLDHMKSRGEVD